MRAKHYDYMLEKSSFMSYYSFCWIMLQYKWKAAFESEGMVNLAREYKSDGQRMRRRDDNE